MPLRFLILFALALSLNAEDKPASTVEQLQAQIAAKDQQLAKLQQKLTIYQQSAFRCQDAMLDQQIDAQTKPPAKPRVVQRSTTPNSPNISNVQGDVTIVNGERQPTRPAPAKPQGETK